MSGSSGLERVASLRRARRMFVRDAHPDRGGDPVAFVLGLRRLDQELETAEAGPTVEAAGTRRSRTVTVVRSPHGFLGRLRVAFATRAARRTHRARLR